MRFLRTRRFLIGLIIVVLAIPGAWLLARDKSVTGSPIVARVKKGEFKVTVSTSGELRALKSVNITVPPNSQQADAYQMKLASIVPEGTIVKVGDVVAELDRSTIASKAAEFALNLQKAEAVYEQAMLDSTLNLSKAREDMRTMELGLEEKRLAKEQSVYEAPTVKRQAEIDYEKAERALAQAKMDYKTKTEQAQAKMREVGSDLTRQRNRVKIVHEVMQGFTIKAPAPGMVIYVKEWNGKKRATGSNVSAWDPAVATLPDLSKMESVTYVNEIDVRKIAVGQPVAITLDSDPTKKLSGTVTSVANVGEERPNTDAKVFEVKLVVEQSDTTLRPGMTTGNAIETSKVDSALFIPLESVNSEGGVPFVYRQSGGKITKQEIVTGSMNDDEVVIMKGLEKDDRVLLAPPADKDEIALNRLPGSTAGAPAVGGDTAATPTVPLTAPQGDTARKAAAPARRGAERVANRPPPS